MLKLIGGLIKAALFALIVLVIGSTVRIGDRTISDQIKVRIASAERSEPLRQAKTVVENIGEEARQGTLQVSREITRKLSQPPGESPRESKEKQRSAKRSEIPSAERQELKNVIDLAN